MEHLHRTYLLKKYLRTKVSNVKKQDITDLIDVVLVDLEKSKFISDKFYSESKSRNLIQRGSSINKIRSYLFSKGIKDNYIKEAIDKRKKAKLARDFIKADSIRDELKKIGVELVDKPGGITEWIRISE